MQTLHDIAEVIADRLDCGIGEAIDAVQIIETRAAYAARAVVELPSFVSVESILADAAHDGMMI